VAPAVEAGRVLREQGNVSLAWIRGREPKRNTAVVQQIAGIVRNLHVVVDAVELGLIGDLVALVDAVVVEIAAAVGARVGIEGGVPLDVVHRSRVVHQQDDVRSRLGGEEEDVALRHLCAGRLAPERRVDQPQGGQKGH
jgi:hypothetical protein